jgi:hypothetical protein
MPVSIFPKLFPFYVHVKLFDGVSQFTQLIEPVIFIKESVLSHNIDYIVSLYVFKEFPEAPCNNKLEIEVQTTLNIKE